MPFFRRLLRTVLPVRAFAAVEAGTRQWLIECPCGVKRDLWDAGGVRYKACGEPRQLYRCQHCGKARWHRVRRKSPQERMEMPGPGQPQGDGERDSATTSAPPGPRPPNRGGLQ